MTFYLFEIIKVFGEVICLSEVIEGYVDRIVFRNEENGYTVLSMDVDEEELTCVGNFSVIEEGVFIEAKGDFSQHPVYEAVSRRNLYYKGSRRCIFYGKISRLGCH